MVWESCSFFKTTLTFTQDIEYKRDWPNDLWLPVLRFNEDDRAV